LTSELGEYTEVAAARHRRLARVQGHLHAIEIVAFHGGFEHCRLGMAAKLMKRVTFRSRSLRTCSSTPPLASIAARSSAVLSAPTRRSGPAEHAGGEFGGIRGERSGRHAESRRGSNKFTP
jgi:hypothetical protein